MAKINLLDVIKYYKGYENQTRAVNYLSNNIPDDVLKEFTRIWRSGSSSADPKAKILKRLADLGISYDKHPSGKAGFTTTIIGLEGLSPSFKLNNDAPDRFNDVVIAIMSDGNGRTKLSAPYICTTEPGAYYTRNRLNRRGAARVQIDMKHSDVWMKGAHKNQSRRLVQIGAAITVTRDGNADGMRTGDYVEKGWFGINFHDGGNSNVNGSIGRWSAGCLVIPKVADCNRFMNSYVYDKQCVNKKFSYILLDASKIF